MFTRFFDMSSGGSDKEDFCTLYIELSKEEAVEFFEGKFGHDPYNVTCECCGPDYYISEMESFGYDADLVIYKEDVEKEKDNDCNGNTAKQTAC